MWIVGGEQLHRQKPHNMLRYVILIFILLWIFLSMDKGEVKKMIVSKIGVQNQIEVPSRSKRLNGWCTGKFRIDMLLSSIIY